MHSVVTSRSCWRCTCAWKNGCRSASHCNWPWGFRCSPVWWCTAPWACMRLFFGMQAGVPWSLSAGHVRSTACCLRPCTPCTVSRRCHAPWASCSPSSCSVTWPSRGSWCGCCWATCTVPFCGGASCQACSFTVRAMRAACWLRRCVQGTATGWWVFWMTTPGSNTASSTVSLCTRRPTSSSCWPGTMCTRSCWPCPRCPRLSGPLWSKCCAPTV